MSRDIHAVTVPKWGIEMQQGTVVNWHLSEGDEVGSGDELVDIETDKIVNTMEAQASGVLRRQVVPEGETLKVGALIGVIAPADVADEAIDAFIESFEPTGGTEANGEADGAAASEASAEDAKPARADSRTRAGGARKTRVRVSPAAKRRAKELGVDLEDVQPAGGRRITPADVERHARQGKTTAPAAEAGGQEYEAVAFSPTRKAIAHKLVEAKQQIPHFYLTTRIGMGAALARREEFNEGGEGKVSVNALVARAAVLALKAVPEVNVHVTPDEIRRFEKVHLAIAVDTERGLMTPVVRDAGALDIGTLAGRIANQAQRARDGALTHEDVESGTFTLSNLGMHGVTHFQAIVNPPQGAILAVGACREILAPGADGPEQVTVVDVSLSCDHRAVDGALGARFLAKLKALLEDPAEL